MARVYTDEQRAWIAEHYPHMSNAELATAFNERFGTDYATRSRMQNYGAQKGLRKTRSTITRGKRIFTDEELDWMRSFVPGHTNDEVAAAFKERFGRSVKVRSIANIKAKMGMRSGVNTGRFRKGNVPFNKGKTWDELGYDEDTKRRMLSTTFKPGIVPSNAYHELLDEITTKDGTYVYVRPRNRKYTANDWIPKAKFVWMQHNGREFPDDHRAVFADHDNGNFDPDNIVAIPNEIYAIVTGGAHGHALPYSDRASLEVTITHARLMRERRRLEMAKRECGVCGMQFTPEFPWQRTCRACLNAGLKSRRLVS